MLKIVGIIFIFVSVSGAGFLLSFSLSEKAKRLIEIKKLINEFINDLSFRKTPVLTLINKIKNDFGNLSFLKRIKNPVSESLKKEIDCDKTLSNEEKLLVFEFSEIIGSTNSDMQINLLKDLNLRVEEKIKNALIEKREKGRLFSLGGVLLGLFVVILIV